MTYYVLLKGQSIQIIPRWKKKLSTEFLTDQEYVQAAALLALNGEFYIPLSKFKIDKVPQKVYISYGDHVYSKLENLIEDIYNTRSYNIGKESAKKRIENLVLKALLGSGKVYGKKISYRFDFIDASNYDIII